MSPRGFMYSIVSTAFWQLWWQNAKICCSKGWKSELIAPSVVHRLQHLFLSTFIALQVFGMGYFMTCLQAVHVPTPRNDHRWSLQVARWENNQNTQTRRMKEPLVNTVDTFSFQACQAISSHGPSCGWPDFLAEGWPVLAHQHQLCFVQSWPCSANPGVLSHFPCIYCSHFLGGQLIIFAGRMRPRG